MGNGTMSAHRDNSESIRRIDSFFSQIVSIIPQELYRHHESSQSELSTENSKYFKHRKVALKADEKKLATKKKLSLKYSGLALNDNEDEHVEVSEDTESFITKPNGDGIIDAGAPETGGKLEDLRVRLHVSNFPQLCTILISIVSRE
jgi:hypothetical protein